MALRTLIPFIAAFFLVPSLLAQKNIEWDESFGGSSWDRLQSMVHTSDGGFAVGGYTRSKDGDVGGHHGFEDYWVLKLDPNGDLQWEKNFGGSEEDQARSIVQTSDGGFAIAGSSESADVDVGGNNGLEDFWVVKLDSSGTLEWEKNLGGSNDDRAHSIVQTADKGFAIAGYSESDDGDVGSNLGWRDFWIVKLDSSGTLEWEQNYGGSDRERAYSIVQTSDSGFAVAGETESSDWDVGGNHGSYDLWVIKLNKNGLLQWEKNFGGSSSDEAASIIQTSDRGFALSGMTSSSDGDLDTNYGDQDLWALKLDSSGGLQWEKNFGGSDWESGDEIIQTADGGFAIGGDSKSQDGDVGGTNGDYDFWALKLDSSGNLQWEENYGGSGSDNGLSIVPTQDGEFAMGGTSRSTDGDVTENIGDNFYWVVKLDSCKNSSVLNPRVCNSYTVPSGDETYKTSGVYEDTLTNSNANGCDSLINVRLSVVSLEFQTIDVSCAGDLNGKAYVTVDAGIPPYTYDWSTGDSTAGISNLSPGDYSVTVTDSTGCTTTDTVTIDGPSPLSLNANSSDVSCAGASDGMASVDMSGGTKPYTYVWSTGDSTSALDSLPGGSYSVTVIDSNGCQVSDTIPIDEPTPLSLSINGTDATCDGTDDGSLTANVSGGGGPYSYKWSTGDTSATIDSLPEGSYSVTVTDSNGCTINGSDTVEVSNALSVSSSVTDADCGRSNGSANVSVSGGSSPYSYVWSSGDTARTADSLPVGNYTVQITDANGCEAFSSVNVKNTGSLTASVGAVTDVTCPGAQDGNIYISVIGGSEPYSYSWSNGATTEDLTDVGSGSYDLEVIDADSCRTMLSATVNEPAPMDLDFSTSEASCDSNDGKVSVNVSGGTPPYSYDWSTGDTTASDSGLSAGDYGVTVTDANGCIDSGLVMIGEQGGPSISVDAVQNSSCGMSDGSVLISASGGTGPYSYQWSNGDTTQDLSGVGPGSYYVVVSDSSSCQAMKSFKVETEDPTQVPICVVTVDSLSRHNLVIWEKPNDPSIEAYNIYKESFSAGNYTKIGTVHDTGYSTFVDTNSNPLVRSNRYKIASVDSCGNEAPLSPKHKTVHLSASENLSGGADLIWDDYKGFSYGTFYIHRYTDSTGWEKLDSVPATVNSYTDINAPVGNSTLRYMVGIRPPEGKCTATRAKEWVNSISNEGSLMDESGSGDDDDNDDTTDTGLENRAESRTTTLYPNPTRGRFTFEWKGMELRSVEVYNMMGERVTTIPDSKLGAEEQGRIDLDLSDRSKGVYWLRIRGAENNVKRSVIVK